MTQSQHGDDGPILVTGGDSVYFPMIEELHQSIRAASPESPALGVIDAGLTAPQVWQLRHDGVTVVQPRPLPHFPVAPLRKRPALAANLGKLWLDRLFPGYRTLVWLDGDTWVQDYAAIELLLGAARNGALAIVPGGGRFWPRPIDVRWLLGGLWGLAQVRSFNFKNGKHADLPLRILRDIGPRPLLNAGVFALRADAPHWEAMRRWQQHILRRGRPFTSDQIAMALAVHEDALPVELLPDTCNYITAWRVDPRSASLREYFYPYPRIGIVHLAGQKAMRFDPAATVEVPDLAGGVHQLSLRYGHFQRMAAALAAELVHQADPARVQDTVLS
ncbi:glycosyltransferase family protein [Rhodopila globiformis]|uniref:glycosyl transferase n=1 Tax=Rhodopila globiformis TaxID=1071 RepID=UPI001874AB11|nr:glycosyl transferase [Rhodopila globiformis]